MLELKYVGVQFRVKYVAILIKLVLFTKSNDSYFIKIRR